MTRIPVIYLPLVGTPAQDYFVGLSARRKWNCTVANLISDHLNTTWMLISSTVVRGPIRDKGLNASRHLQVSLVIDDTEVHAFVRQESTLPEPGNNVLLYS